MKKYIAILLAALYLSISAPISSEARLPRRMQYEDTVGESIWDWATTLGKSPQEKKTIKAKRRIQRAKKRADKKARIKKARLEKKNITREREAKKAREARIRVRRREIERRRRQSD